MLAFVVMVVQEGGCDPPSPAHNEYAEYAMCGHFYAFLPAEGPSSRCLWHTAFILCLSTVRLTKPRAVSIIDVSPCQMQVRRQRMSPCIPRMVGRRAFLPQSLRCRNAWRTWEVCAAVFELPSLYDYDFRQGSCPALF